jgi:transposase-like protein
MHRTYSKEFKEQALNKVLSRGKRTIESVAAELNMSVFTLKDWKRSVMPEEQKSLLAKEKRPQDWSNEERLIALHESHGLSEEALNAWCREKGLFKHHLEAWQASFCGKEKSGQQEKVEYRLLKAENQQLKRELARKEKALAEAAALLVLQKKYQALWEDEAK